MRDTVGELNQPAPGNGVQNYAPGRGGRQNLPFSANSAPMKARITKLLWEVVWLKILIVCNVGNPKSISSRSNKFDYKKS